MCDMANEVSGYIEGIFICYFQGHPEYTNLLGVLLGTPLTHVLCVDTGRSSETAKAHRG
eukprot:TRINITY_DN269_c0_g1_i1.p1 TRINITY_DN269_c0_g1~~TRINITY_DN269_c0_g1_i1.p1  ORF type:complete len:59 (+),score=15.69 TRINITY_DN269_c0_g1_i1:117-293(+)